jgi:hypothetical protein
MTAAIQDEELTTAALLLLWDQRRPRTLQAEFGISELGQCRRRAGYRLNGIEPSNVGGSVQAVMGTAVHDAVASVYHELQAAGIIPAEDLIEYEVRFAGILGHLDRYEAAAHRIIDTKTTTSRWLGHLKIYGPSLANLWQVHTYAAALIAEGRRVDEVAIDYLARDTGEEFRWTGPFEPTRVRDALDWVRTVRTTPLEWLARDYDRDSPFCQHCPFLAVCWSGGVPDRDPRSVLFIEDPDGAKWAGKLEQARADEADAKRRVTEAKGALDALRPDDTTELVDVGYEHLLRFRLSEQRRLDGGAVRAEYAAAGQKPPTKQTVVTYVDFVPRPVAEEPT